MADPEKNEPQPKQEPSKLPENNIGAVVGGLRTLTSLPLDKMLTLFLCLGFGFLLYEDKRAQSERDAQRTRAIEDSRENDRRFHSEQREKDRTFYSRERELDRTAIGSLALKIERIETSIWNLRKGQEEEDDVTVAPMPKCKSTSN
jgi:uncharacterized protein HemX